MFNVIILVFFGDIHYIGIRPETFFLIYVLILILGQVRLSKDKRAPHGKDRTIKINKITHVSIGFFTFYSIGF